MNGKDEPEGDRFHPLQMELLAQPPEFLLYGGAVVETETRYRRWQPRELMQPELPCTARFCWNRPHSLPAKCATCSLGCDTQKARQNCRQHKFCPDGGDLD